MPVQPLGGDADAFVTKLGATGSRLLFSNLIGGPRPDFAQGVAVDSAGSAYVTGITYALLTNGFASFPTDSGVVQQSPRGGNDGWAAKYNSFGGRGHVTYIGGSGTENGTDVTVDPATGAAVLTGSTSSTNFPSTTGIANSGGVDAYVTQLNPAASAFTYGRYLGGSSGDVALGIALDSTGHVYVAGFTNSATFNGVSTPGNQDGFVVKLNP